MRISKDTLKGYLLEESIAYLIKNTGYNLLVDKSQDPIELEQRSNGLVVIGRGGKHQADVLGQLSWIPTFTYPIRLFVEAKFRNSKSGIDLVRNAVGIIEDLNQNFSPMKGSDILVKRYNYNYALFSTSGFSKDAIKMAIAHRISLIDLSGNEYLDLRNAIDLAAERLVNTFATLTYGNDIDNHRDDNQDNNQSSGSFIYQLRMYLRGNLDILPEIIPNIQVTNQENLFRDCISGLIAFLRQYSELFVGMANGPFLLVFKADNIDNFMSFVRNNQTHKVTIHWNSEDEGGRKWYIRPANSNAGTYQLSFVLPKILGDWIFNGNNHIDRALDAKKQFLSSITIYRSTEEKDELFRLNYSFEDTHRLINGED